MKDLNSIISGLNKSGMLSGFAGGLAGGSLSGALMGSKKGRKMGKSALKVGALAAVGGLAWKAYQSYSQQKQAQPAAGNNRFNYAPQQLTQNQFDQVIEDQSQDCGQMLLLRAMIAAAYADGHIDEQERQRIFEQVEQMDLSVEDKASLFDELRRPLSMQQLINKVPDSQTGIEVYTASLLAIDEHQPASQQYLGQLASQLCIPNELVQSIHQQYGTMS